MNQVLGVAKKAIERINKISSHLFRPICVWVNTNASNVYGARFDLNDEKHHLPYRARHAKRFNSEKVARIKCFPMRLQEVRPSSCLLSFRSRVQSLFAQDVSRTVVRPISIFSAFRDLLLS